MPKVLHIVTSLAVGGAQKHLKALLAGLATQGWHSDVVYFKDPAMRPELAPHAGTLHHVPLGSASSPCALWQVLRIIQNGRYALVHTHLLKADAMGAVAGMLAGVPVVSTKHNDERALLNPAIGVIHGLLSRRIARTVVISEHVAQFMRIQGRVQAGNMVHIPYGLDLTEAAPPETPEPHAVHAGPHFVSIGRLDPQKGHETLLRAASLVLREEPAFTLAIVGDTQHGGAGYLSTLRALRAELGIAESVTFLGVRDDTAALLAQADAFVLASRWEGFGLVFLEAMAAARAVVATRVSAVPEVVENNVTGLLVPPDDPAALAEAMLKLIQDSDRARQMGRAGFDRVRAHFSAAAMVERTADLYDACKKERG